MSDAKTAGDERAEHWQALIEAWQASGQSQQAFCRANELNYPAFGYWLRKFRQQGTVTPAPPRRRSGVAAVVAAPMMGELTVCLPNGIELRGITEHNLAVVTAGTPESCNKVDLGALTKKIGAKSLPFIAKSNDKATLRFQNALYIPQCAPIVLIMDEYKRNPAAVTPLFESPHQAQRSLLQPKPASCLFSFQSFSGYCHKR